MTQQVINVGSAINDGTGDPVRVAFTHCNENFTELYQVSRPTGNAIEFQFNNATTEPPASGQIRFNQATQASTNKMWVSHTTSSGVNIKQFLAAATTGAKLVLQDKIDNTNFIKFDVTGVPVDKTTYWEFAVAVTASGGNLPNAAILAAVTAAAGGGGNVSNVGTPTSGQYGRWTGATTIEGVAPATVLSDIGAASAASFPAGAWTAWTPTITSSTGAITSSTINKARYTVHGKTVIAHFDVSIVNQGTGAGFLQISLPVTALAASGVAHGREIVAGGYALAGYLTATTVVALSTYSGSTCVLTGHRHVGMVIYEAA